MNRPLALRFDLAAAIAFFLAAISANMSMPPAPNGGPAGCGAAAPGGCVLLAPEPPPPSPLPALVPMFGPLVSRVTAFLSFLPAAIALSKSPRPPAPPSPFVLPAEAFAGAAGGGGGGGRG
eukprot:COSAG02_NODE_34772_length_478_cov_1.034301_1_plen_120_part_10